MNNTNRVRSREGRNELIPVWDLKPAWKQVLFTWRFISAAFQNDPIFWWTCVGISFWVVFKWYFTTRNETTYLSEWHNEITPAMSFKRSCALNAISNESALTHFASGKLCSHENLMSVWNFISVKMTDTGLSFISPKLMWPQVKGWLNTKVSIKMKSHSGLTSFCLSCERTLTTDSLRILTGKTCPQVKLKCLWKVGMWTIG